VVEELHFLSTVTTILVQYLICNISQHDNEISQINKNIPRVFDVTPSNFLYMD